MLFDVSVKIKFAESDDSIENIKKVKDKILIDFPVEILMQHTDII